MVVDDPRTRRELEAAAFGRAVTPEDEAAAARALKSLRELDDRASAGRAGAVGIPAATALGVGGARRAAATGVGVASGPVMVEVIDDSQAIRRASRNGAWSGAPDRVAETLRRFWLVPVVVASIALGAVAGSLATRATEMPPASLAPVGQSSVPPDSASPGGTTVVADPVIPLPPSDADGSSAEDWLNQPRRPIDTFPDEPGLMAFGIDPYSTHVVTTDRKTNVWVARGSNRSLCLLMVATADGSFQARCTPPEFFPDKGVSAQAEDGTFAHWGADGVTVSAAG
jgi:hypothetical protein